MRLHATALAVALTAFAGIAQAAPGDLDPTFGLGGRVTTDFNLSTDIANAVALQADGKLVVVGTTYTNNDYSGEDFAIARYNPDGSIDSSFGTNGRVTTDFPGLAAVASSVLVQPDGKILVAGGAYPLFVFLGNFELARYNADGSLDTSFGDGGIVTTLFPHGSYAFALALQSDGKILIDLSRKADGARIVVSDNGKGMTRDELRRALEGLRTGADGRPERRQGLGIPLARQLVEAHGGSLQLVSRQGEGTTATILLP